MAVVAGGPGAVFWMMCAALFGMTSKFAECTLAMHYRSFDDDGFAAGGQRNDQHLDQRVALFVEQKLIQLRKLIEEVCSPILSI